jgi:hypothetical protein
VEEQGVINHFEPARVVTADAGILRAVSGQVRLALLRPAVVVLKVAAPEIHGFGEEGTVTAAECAAAFGGQRQGLAIHPEIREHEIEVSGQQHRPIRQAGVLMPVPRSPAAVIRIVGHAVKIPIHGEQRAVEFDWLRAPRSPRETISPLKSARPFFGHAP